MLKIFSKNKGKPGQVGLYVSGDKLCLAHVVFEKDAPRLVYSEVIKVSSEKDRQKQLQEQVNKLGLENTRTAYILAPNDYKLYLVEAPSVEPQEMAAAAKWKIKDLVDSPLEELAITIFPVPEDAYRGQNAKVYAVTSRKSRIRNIVEFVNESGLNLQTIDIPELAMMNIANNFGDDSNGLAFIHLSANGSTLNLSKDGLIYLTRHLNTRIDQDVINSAEWESVKERLILEIGRSLDYYQSQMGQSPITKIMLPLDEEENEQLITQLNEAMGFQVTALDLADRFAGENEKPKLQPGSFMAIGGAMRTGKTAA